MTNISARDLRRAAALKERIEGLQGELDRVLGGASSGAPVRSAGPGRRGPMSAAAKARLAAIARARWKKAKASGKSHL